MERERGNSLFDARNRLVISFGYELPRWTGGNLAQRMLLGGWQLNGIFQVQSGYPLTAVNAAMTAQSLTFRPNMTCNPNSLQNRSAGASNLYFDTSCFSLPTVAANGTTQIDNSRSGNEPRGAILGPAFNTTDASIFKTFNVSETQRAELRFEAFNVFNEAHFAQPNLTFILGAANQASTATSSNFGRITQTIGNDSRVVQLAFKYSF
jgi:hypothetical protein